MDPYERKIQKGRVYYFHKGIFYRRERLGYVPVPAPISIATQDLPEQFILCLIDEKKIVLSNG